MQPAKGMHEIQLRYVPHLEPPPLPASDRNILGPVSIGTSRSSTLTFFFFGHDLIHESYPAIAMPLGQDPGCHGLRIMFDARLMLNRFET